MMNKLNWMGVALASISIFVARTGFEYRMSVSSSAPMDQLVNEMQSITVTSNFHFKIPFLKQVKDVIKNAASLRRCE